MTDQPISPSSQGSGDSTSPSKPSGSDASDKSSGTSPVPLFSSDTGPASSDGETLLPTPTVADVEGGRTRRSGDRGDEILSVRGAVSSLLPTPTANDDKGAGYMQAKGRKYPTLPGAVGGTNHYEGLISSAEGSPANPSATPDDARDTMTNATSGPTSPASSVRLDPPWSSSRTFRVCELSGETWLTDQTTLFAATSQPSETFFGTWPAWGSMRDGVVYEHPTPARVIVESASSSSLNVPTPTASDSHWNDSDSEREGIKGNHNLSLVSWARQLPTPTSRDWKGSRPKEGRTPGDLLPEAIDDLLPTPRTPTGGPETPAMRDARGNSHGDRIDDVLRSLGDPTNPLSNDGPE